MTPPPPPPAAEPENFVRSEVDNLVHALSKGPSPGQTLDDWAAPVNMWTTICNFRSMPTLMVSAFGSMLEKAGVSLDASVWWWLCAKNVNTSGLLVAITKTERMLGRGTVARIKNTHQLASDMLDGHTAIIGRTLVCAPEPHADLLGDVVRATPNPSQHMLHEWWSVACLNPARHAAPLLTTLWPFMPDQTWALNHAIQARHTTWARPHTTALPQERLAALAPACMGNGSIALIKATAASASPVTWANEMLLQSLAHVGTEGRGAAIASLLRTHWDCALTTKATWRDINAKLGEEQALVLAQMLTPEAQVHPLLHNIGVTFERWNARNARAKLNALLPKCSQKELVRALGPTKELIPEFITTVWNALDTNHRRLAAQRWPLLSKDPDIARWVLTDAASPGVGARALKM